MKQLPYTSSTMLCASALALLCSAAQAAPPPPDAGQLTRELKPQQQPSAPAPSSTSALRIQDGASTTQADSGTVIDVQSIHVLGSSVFSAHALEALVSDLQGAKHSLGEVAAGAQRITEYYRAHGYLLARAYLPAQDIHDGSIDIQVLEGALGEIKIDNHSRLTDAHAGSYLAHITPGQTIMGQRIDRALLLLSDTPGVGAARAVLQPGTAVGTSDLLIHLDPAPAYLAHVDLDNGGNRYTGEYRASATLALNSPLGLGDLFSAHVLNSGPGLSYIRLGYQLPIGASGLQLGTALANTTYQLGEDFAALQATGRASTGSVYLSYPLVRSTLSNVTSTLSWERKILTDLTGAPASESDKQVSESTLGLSGNHQDTLGAGGVTSADVLLSLGALTMDDASAALDAAPSSAQSQGVFRKLAYTLNRLQGLGPRDSMMLSVQGQLADENLASSEKFALGGATGVRAYPQGEGSGDQGWLASVEWRHSLSEALQGVLFYDGGQVNINHNAYLSSSNSRSIAGVGLGLNGSFGHLQFKTALAWRTDGGTPTSEPPSADRNPRLWAQMSYSL
jgi:hemolysin activation/secretion protein